MSDNRVVISARSGRALEERLLKDLQTLVGDDPSLLARPVLVVVPSASLRRHLQVSIAQGLGAAVLGVQVQLVGHVAADVLRRAGHTAPRGGLLFDVLARRAAEEQKSLREALAGLSDGYGVASSSIRDLLSAGLDDNGTAAQDALPAWDTRARAVVDAATRTHGLMRELGVGRRANTMQAAAAALQEAGCKALPARAILVYGFADAPGLTRAFLRALLRQENARIYVDRPCDPADRSREEPGCRFVDRFLERLGQAQHPDHPFPESKAGSPPHNAFTTSGTDAEAREIAHRIRELIDQGTSPEKIAIVARQLDRHAAALRRRLRERAIPFSGGTLPPSWSPTQRGISAICELLRTRGRALIDRWLDATSGFASDSDVRLALRVIGCTRLIHATTLDLDPFLRSRDTLALPARRGLNPRQSEGTGDEDATPESARGVRNEKRVIQRHVLEQALANAREIHRLLADWPTRAPLQTHAERARDLARILGLDEKESPVADARVAARWQDALNELIEHDPTFEVSDDEFRVLLESALQGGAEPMGGQGGGVAVMDVSHARGLTFDHLFMMGLERHVFPRSISEDPLLADRQRHALQSVLPDLATADASHDEERVLFASLLGAADRVTLSWQRSDEEGREIAASPFVERMLHAGRLTVSKVTRDLVKVAKERPVTARDAALALALSAPRALFHRALAPALAEARALLRLDDGMGQAMPEPDIDALADARMRTLEAVDPSRDTPEGQAIYRGPSPWFGSVGKVRAGVDDPRNNDLYVTALEGMARCPWQLFLSRDLNVERPPDPLASPPEFSRRLIGIVVHGTLEHLISAALPDPRPRTIAEAIASGTTDVTMPDEEAVVRALEDAVREHATEEGLHLGGLHQALAQICMPLVRRALSIDWSGGSVAVLGVELRGETPITIGDKTETLHFKADRVDGSQDGSVLFTDYKTGKPVSNAKTPQTRTRHLSQKIRSGELLQAGAYAQSSEGGRGRYLYVEEDIDEDNRAAYVDATGEAADAFAATASALITARADGILFPRLGDGKGQSGKACRTCQHMEACVQGDSALKMRLEHMAERCATETREGKTLSPFERHLARLWPVDQEAGA